MQTCRRAGGQRGRRRDGETERRPPARRQKERAESQSERLSANPIAQTETDTDGQDYHHRKQLTPAHSGRAQSRYRLAPLLDRRPMRRRPLRRARCLLRRRLHLRVPGLHRRPLPGFRCSPHPPSPAQTRREPRANPIRTSLGEPRCSDRADHTYLRDARDLRRAKPDKPIPWVK